MPLGAMQLMPDDLPSPMEGSQSVDRRGYLSPLGRYARCR